MEVFLELVPQDGQLGPMRIMHWAMRVGNGSSSVVYEFEQNGVYIGPSTSCNHGFKIETQRLGVTDKPHDQIRAWANRFDRTYAYNVAGSDFGGRNCQDFVFELCSFLGVGTSQLPSRQAKQVEAAAVGTVLAVGALAVGGALLAHCLAKDGVRWMWGDAGIIPSMAQSNPLRWSKKKNVQATIKELESHLGSAREQRPVLLSGHTPDGKMATLPTVAAAIACLRELSETA